MEVVYNGIDQDVKPLIARNDVRRELGVEEDTVLIGSVGSLVGRKRFCDMVDAVAALKEKGKPVVGIVVGEGPERKNLESQIKDAGVKDFFLLPGFKQDPLSYLCAMDVFVLPSRREGFPRVILEAMLMNLPVVACSVAGPLEQVVHGETGYLYDAGDVENLSGFLAHLADSSDLRMRMGARSREVVLEKFSMQAYINGVERVFAEVLT
jgi:glycosyltransferase involved in cell wall biosynthesis